MNDYFVYGIFDANWVPRYIGASSASNSADRIHQWHLPSAWQGSPVGRWLKSVGGPPHITRLATGLSFKEASSREAYLIDTIGRQCLGTGPLLNVLDGGLPRRWPKLKDAGSLWEPKPMSWKDRPAVGSPAAS